MPAEGIIIHGLSTAAIHILEKLWRIRFWRLRIIYPNTEIRVSFSAFLRVHEGGKYILVRNLHRPELFGPFGGVYKFYDGASHRLDELSFRPQDLGETGDMRNDLRGFLPRKNLARLLKWFDKNVDRESPRECLLRELREELIETKLPNLWPPSQLEVKLVRRVQEGPEKVPGRSYTQFRVFEVYDLVGHNPEYYSLLERLKQINKDAPNVVVADSSDIVCGRCDDGRVIGNHVLYLLGKKRTRPEAPPFAKA